MGKTDKARQRAYRQRMIEKGYRQFAFWLDTETQTAINDLKPADADLSAVVSQAIKHYHSSRANKASKAVSKNVSSHVKPFSSNVSKNVTSNRYMPPELEDHILDLRQSGMTLQAIANKLASDGHHNAKGEPYSTGTISKAETRARKRAELKAIVGVR